MPIRIHIIQVQLLNPAAMANQRSSTVQLSVTPFGKIKDPITNNDEDVSEYIWTNTATKTTVKVNPVDSL